MAPTIDIPDVEEFERTKKYLDLHNVDYNISDSNKPTQIAELDKSNWIVVPQEEGKKFKAISGYSFEASPARLAFSPAVEKVAKELNKTLENNLRINYENTATDSLSREFVGNNNWYESMILPQFLGVKAKNMPEELDYLHFLYLGSKKKIKVFDVSGKPVDSKLCEKLLMDKIKVKSPWRANWIDANYKTKLIRGNEKDKKILEVHSDHVFDKKGNIIDYQSEILDSDTLMKDKQIDVIDYIIKNHTSQGHVSKKVKSGNFHSWYPRDDNNSVAGLGAYSGGAGLDCDRYPSDGDPVLGVDVVAPKK